MTRSIPKRVRDAVVARDGLVCRYCRIAVTPRGSGPPRPDELHFDHVLPWGDGGDHSVENVVVSCASCNLGRVKPRFSIRHEPLTHFRYGNYWWRDHFQPPVVADDSHCLESLRQYLTRTGRPLAWALRLIGRGELPATTEGPIYVDSPIEPPRRRRSR